MGNTGIALSKSNKKNYVEKRNSEVSVQRRCLHAVSELLGSEVEPGGCPF